MNDARAPFFIQFRMQPAYGQAHPNSNYVHRDSRLGEGEMPVASGGPVSAIVTSWLRSKANFETGLHPKLPHIAVA